MEQINILVYSMPPLGLRVEDLHSGCGAADTSATTGLQYWKLLFSLLANLIIFITLDPISYIVKTHITWDVPVTLKSQEGTDRMIP